MCHSLVQSPLSFGSCTSPSRTSERVSFQLAVVWARHKTERCSCRTHVRRTPSLFLDGSTKLPAEASCLSSQDLGRLRQLLDAAFSPLFFSRPRSLHVCLLARPPATCPFSFDR